MSKPYDLIAPGADRETVERALAEAFAGRGTDAFAGRAAARDRLAPAFAATGLGHTVEWDPPAALTSLRSRWTCVRCGNAVLHARAGHMYGSAIEGPCAGPEASR